MFRFAHTDILWLLVAIPVMVAILMAVAILRRRAVAKFGNPQLLAGLMPDVSIGRVRFKSVLFITSYALIVLSAAQPQLGSKLREEKREGIEMMLVVDVSNSMLAEDFTPSRIDRTRYAIDKLFSSLTQDRVGLVVFAGEAKVQLPITSDYRMAKNFARKLSPSLVATQGTDLGQAMSLAALSFSTSSDRSRAMILITDGEAHDANAIDVARRISEQGIKIFTIGIGTPEGAPIKIGGEFIRDDKGDMVVSRLNEDLLQQIASIGNGGYVRASNQTFGLEEIVNKINDMERSEFTTLRFDEYNEQFQWSVGLAIVLLVFELLVLSRRNPALNRFNIFNVKRL